MNNSEEVLPRAARLALLSAAQNLLLGAAALGLGLEEGAISLWSLGAACLLQVPLALSLRGRLREGLGNRRLDRERRTLRSIGHLLRLLALGVALASGAAMYGQRTPESSITWVGLALLGLGILALHWRAKRGLAKVHPSLASDSARARTLLELALLASAGALLGRYLPWGDALFAMVIALRIFVEGRNLAKATALQAACGGCGSGCGCG